MEEARGYLARHEGTNPLAFKRWYLGWACDFLWHGTVGGFARRATRLLDLFNVLRSKRWDSDSLLFLFRVMLHGICLFVCLSWFSCAFSSSFRPPS